MPKTLIAIVNARHRADWRDVIRKTWLPQVPKDRADIFFFVGKGDPISDSDGIVELDCSDAYKDLPAKIQSITRWALSREYDHLLKIDDDVVLRPQAFLDSGFDKHDFSGGMNRPGPCPVTFGFCYILSRKSMEAVAVHSLPHDFDDEKWVAQVLREKGIQLTNADGYSLHQRTTENPSVKIARCVHLDSTHTQAQKLQEFERIFNSPPWTGELLLPRKMTYDSTGLITNWWDRHPR
jgi:hypothetical protein